MDELFGIPMESLAVGIVVALALVVSAVGALAVRNRIFFKLGIRNVTRRRARTALIVLGLTIRTAAITSLGQTDELVSVRGAEVDTEVEVGGTTGIEYFSEDVFPEIEYELLLGHEDLIDGVAPAIVEPLAVQSVTTRQSEPRVTLFASSQAHLGAFGEVRRHSDGEPQYLNDLRRGEVFLNADAAEELQAEPGHELRLARAVGTRRGHLVQLYLFEGLVYDLFAAVVGVFLGVAVAFGMVFILASALDFTGVEIRHDVQPESLVVGFGLGVLLTFVIVTLSAVRVSRLNIVGAIRNTPEPMGRRSRKLRWIPGTLAVLAGILLALAGLSSANAASLMLGVSLVVVGGVPLARVSGLSERIVFTAAGLLLVVQWLLPFSVVETLAGKELMWGFGVWIMGGIFVVLGSAWTLMFNADLLLGGLTASVGRIRALTPVLRMAIAYPLRNRFRTGVTLAMFTLVVFTMVVGAVISGSFVHAMDNPEQFGGGFDVRAQAAPTNPIVGMEAAIRRAPGLDPARFAVVSEQSFLAAEARQIGYDDGFTDYGLRGLDEPFLRSTTYGFSAMARGYESADEIWRALADEPGLAVVDAIGAPRRDNWSAGAVLPDFKLQGFVLEDGVFDPLTLATRDPQTGKKLQLTVIGILAETVPFAMQGISTSQETLAGAYVDRVQPTAYYYALAEGADPRAVAPELESAFVANGLEADALEELLEDSIAVQWTFNRLIQGFMGLGLIVGIAALGVISARAVVERRQQIGILRALGFRRRMIQVSFLIESSFIALTAIIVGTLLALIIAVNIIDDVGSQSSWNDLAIVVPWVNLAIIFGTVYAAALLATLGPAVRASRVYPAEALRYE